MERSEVLHFTSHEKALEIFGFVERFIAVNPSHTWRSLSFVLSYDDVSNCDVYTLYNGKGTAVRQGVFADWNTIKIPGVH